MTRESVARTLNRGINLNEFEFKAKRVQGRCTVYLYDRKRKVEGIMASALTWQGALTQSQQQEG